MKKTAHLVLLFLGITMFQFTSAQSWLKGNWRVFCVYDGYELDRSGKTVCTLCPTIKRNDGFTIQGLEMNFQNDQIELNFNNERKETINYSWDDASKSILFRYKDVNYRFKVQYAKDYYLLTNSDGRQLLLSNRQCDK